MACSSGSSPQDPCSPTQSAGPSNSRFGSPVARARSPCYEVAANSANGGSHMLRPLPQQQEEQHSHGSAHHAADGGVLTTWGKLFPSDTSKQAADGHHREQSRSVSPGRGSGIAVQVSDEAGMYGELMAAIRRGGAGLHAESILERLLNELGAARASLSSERGELRALKATLSDLQTEDLGCEGARRLAQEHVDELRHQLDSTQRSLADVTADRDLFLKRLQQLESEPGFKGVGPGGRAELQRQTAHAEQVRHRLPMNDHVHCDCCYGQMAFMFARNACHISACTRLADCSTVACAVWQTK